MHIHTVNPGLSISNSRKVWDFMTRFGADVRWAPRGTNFFQTPYDPFELFSTLYHARKLNSVLEVFTQNVQVLYFVYYIFGYSIEGQVIRISSQNLHGLLAFRLVPAVRSRREKAQRNKFHFKFWKIERDYRAYGRRGDHTKRAVVFHSKVATPFPFLTSTLTCTARASVQNKLGGNWFCPRSKKIQSLCRITLIPFWIFALVKSNGRSVLCFLKA